MLTVNKTGLPEQLCTEREREREREGDRELAVDAGVHESL